jgi:Ca-activated chloride channel family protein
MNVLWPWFLWSLLLLPLAVAGYIWILRRRRKTPVRFSSLSLIRAAQPERSRWRRHVPFALLLVAFASLMTASARPQAEMTVPLSRTTIILAMDTSRSMCATDVEPNRLTVAQDAALAFVEDQPEGTQIGIVAFAGFAEIVVPPTADKARLQDAIRSFSTSLGTAIGSAQLKAIDAIAEVNPDVAYSGVDLGGETDAAAADMMRAQLGYQPDIIVLLTDGANSGGPNPIDAAQQAVDRRVRVYTIGFGTDNPGQMVCSRQQAGSDIFGGGFGFGMGGGGGNFRQFIVIDEDTLQTIAEMTGGQYFRAENADQLLDIFRDLPTQIVLAKENIELSALFSAVGAFFIIVAMLLSLRWNRLP